MVVLLWEVVSHNNNNFFYLFGLCMSELLFANDCTISCFTIVFCVSFITTFIHTVSNTLLKQNNYLYFFLKLVTAAMAVMHMKEVTKNFAAVEVVAAVEEVMLLFPRIMMISTDPFLLLLFLQ